MSADQKQAEQSFDTRQLAPVALWMQHCQTHNGQFKNKHDLNQRTRDIIFFIPDILLPCQNLAPTLPTMQLDH